MTKISQSLRHIMAEKTACITSLSRYVYCALTALLNLNQPTNQLQLRRNIFYSFSIVIVFELLRYTPSSSCSFVNNFSCSFS